MASATDGAAPNRPAKLFGLNRSPKRAKVETDTPPIRKRINISFIGPATGRGSYDIGVLPLKLEEESSERVGCYQDVLRLGRHVNTGKTGSFTVGGGVINSE